MGECFPSEIGLFIAFSEGSERSKSPILGPNVEFWTLNVPSFPLMTLKIPSKKQFYYNLIVEKEVKVE